MLTASLRRFATSLTLMIPTMVLTNAATAQSPFFAPGNVVVVVSGCGVQGGTCANVPFGYGTNNGYGDNQGTPLTLFQFQPTGTASAAYVNSLVLSQTGSGANFPVSAEYGSSSEGTMQLSGSGQYLTVMGYGINAATYNGSPATYGTLAAKPTALAQSGSLTGQSYTPVARVIALIDANGNVNSATGLYNIFNLNNPRSIYTLNGTTAYVSGQGSGADATSGIFYTPIGAVNNSPTAITGLDTTSKTVSQDTRQVQIFNNTLYVAVDSKGGSNAARDFMGTLGTPPSTTLFNSNNGPTQIAQANNASAPVAVSSNGKLTLTNSETNGINASGTQINLSPSGFFFANAYTMYIADGGNSKQTSATSLLGDGGLQKWVNTKTDGTGTWELMYTMSAGLSLVSNSSAAGTTGLYGVTGLVSGASVYLYVTNYTINDLDQTYLYGITDTLAATAQPTDSPSANAFTLLATAPSDSNFKGVSLAPTSPSGSATITTVPSGLTVTTAGTGCAPGTYVTPVTLIWTPSSSCTLTTTTPQTSLGTYYAFNQWQDGTTSTTDTVTASSVGAAMTYTATFAQSFQPVGVFEKALDTSTASATVTQGDSLLVSGWVGDAGATISSVKVYVDGTLFGTPTTGLARPDVPSYPNSGYQLIASTSGLSIATHAVTVIAIDSAGRTTTFGPMSISVVATPPAYVFLTGSGTVGSVGATGLQTSGATVGGGTGAAVDASGNVWSINGNGTSLTKFTPAGASSASYSPTGLAGGSALVIDGSSKILVTGSNGKVSVVSNAGATVSTLSGSTSSAPTGIAVDVSGDLWVANPVGTVDEFIGAGTPVLPLSTAVQNDAPASKP
jgi:hypothetical protein